MDELSNRQQLLSSIKKHNKGRDIRLPQGVKWGEMILPAGDEIENKNVEGLKVLAICSWTLGFLTFETLKLMERRLPGKLNLVGLVTDDPTDRNAKISQKRRFWRYYDKPRQEEFEQALFNQLSPLEFHVTPEILRVIFLEIS